MTVIIGGAWPYANGSLHLGHIAALLPGDILARYYRQKGQKVLYVSGSDCNGTPISIRAKQENKTTKEIANRYHNEFVECFKKLGFTYDFYTRTDAEHHHQSVQKIFLTLLEHGYLYKKKVKQAYCEIDQQFLPDRYVEGSCPNCGANARGDQCDYCSAILDPLDLHNKKCKLCGAEPVIKETEHYYFSFSTFQEKLEQYTLNAEKNNRWRANALALTKRYLSEGLPDRAVTRDLPNGIDVPVPGFEGKKIYVWIEAVAGYLTASIEWTKQHGESIERWWNEDTISYYVHGKDNIPFHTVIWPAILLGLKNQTLPTHIISNEYLTLEKRKLSTSQNWAVWVPDLLKRYHPDSIRYFLTINAPESRDADFSWREFIYSHNGELLGAFGNFVNRTLKFIEKAFDSVIPQSKIEDSIQLATKKVFLEVGSSIEQGHFKQALEIIFDYIRSANRYFDNQKPWIQVKENIEECSNTLATCVFIIQNLSQLLQPFLPFASSEIKKMLNIQISEWKVQWNLPKEINNLHPLYERIDSSRVEEELKELFSKL